MAYIVVGGDRRFLIDPELLETTDFDELYSVMLDDTEYRLNVSRITPTHLSILVGNRSYNVEVERKDQGFLVSTRGEVFTFKVQDERSMAAEGEEGTREPVIVAPMPGLVTKLLVEEGDVVESGDKLLVLEAMKMQSDIAAPGPGTIAKVFVSAGDTVMAGVPLIRME